MTYRISLQYFSWNLDDRQTWETVESFLVNDEPANVEAFIEKENVRILNDQVTKLQDANVEFQRRIEEHEKRAAIYMTLTEEQKSLITVHNIRPDGSSSIADAARTQLDRNTTEIWRYQNWERSVLYRHNMLPYRWIAKEEPVYDGVEALENTIKEMEYHD